MHHARQQGGLSILFYFSIICTKLKGNFAEQCYFLESFPNKHAIAIK